MKRSVRRCLLRAAALVGLLCAALPALAAGDAVKKVLILAGEVRYGPGGHPAGAHEYEKSARLLEHSLNHAPNLSGIEVEVRLGGWPADPAALGEADTIVLISGGADRNEADHPLLAEGRLAALGEQMRRGCGLVVIHWGLFVPRERGGREFLDWIGGYFDYESGPGPRNWFSQIKTAAARPEPASPSHPVSRGLAPFELREEFYYNIRFREDGPRPAPILDVPLPGVETPQTVAWALEREDSGRGFGFTGGHFFENWYTPGFRKMVLNAIVWTAGAGVPAGGVESNPPRPVRALILTGHHHPAHDWPATTEALRDALNADWRFVVEVTGDPEWMAENDPGVYDVIVQNYCNWERPGWSGPARAKFENYLKRGGALSVIHFANGAFRDWPAYYGKIVRRVWVDGVSGHDDYGPFRVRIVRDHPITKGLSDFETVDELYYRQQGDLPIEPLAVARSKVTGKDEPMAWAYRLGEGRVFQTVLGHAEESLRTAGTARLILQGSLWAAGRRE